MLQIEFCGLVIKKQEGKQQLKVGERRQLPGGMLISIPPGIKCPLGPLLSISEQ